MSVATCNKTYKSFFHNTWSSLLRANWILLSKKPGAVTFIFVIAYISLLMRGANLKLGWCMSVLFEAEGVLINLVQGESVILCKGGGGAYFTDRKVSVNDGRTTSSNNNLL